jgi:hypothetical protein
MRYDFSSGVLDDPVTVATFPHGPLADDRGIDWTVDKYSGDIAYVDAADAVHVIDPASCPSWTSVAPGLLGCRPDVPARLRTQPDTAEFPPCCADRRLLRIAGP